MKGAKEKKKKTIKFLRLPGSTVSMAWFNAHSSPDETLHGRQQKSLTYIFILYTRRVIAGRPSMGWPLVVYVCLYTFRSSSFFIFFDLRRPSSLRCWTRQRYKVPLCCPFTLLFGCIIIVPLSILPVQLIIFFLNIFSYYFWKCCPTSIWHSLFCFLTHKSNDTKHGHTK